LACSLVQQPKGVLRFWCSQLGVISWRNETILAKQSDLGNSDGKFEQRFCVFFLAALRGKFAAVEIGFAVRD
jgi:hypothetical protein